MADVKLTDLLVLGATGFTGRLVVRYLATHPDFLDHKFTFALAGRSLQKLARLADELNLAEDKVQHVLVDVLDPIQVKRAVLGARVVINVAGPYWRWGRLVVKECAENGVHYVDLAGEPPFLQHIVTEYHAAAQRTHAVLIPCSGHDAIPADASAFLSAQALKQFAGPNADVARSDSRFEGKGGISGGTFASMLVTVEDVPIKLFLASQADYAFSPELRGKSYPRLQMLYTLPLSSPPARGAYYPMAPVDRLVVQRTWALLQSSHSDAPPVGDGSEEPAPYGPDFVYDEHLGVPNALAGLALSSVVFLFTMAMAFRPFRWLFKKVIPQPGEGPSEALLQNGWFKVTNVSSTAPDAHGKQTHVRTVIEGKGDPGYLITSMYLVESALALALEHERLPALAQRGGVLTPMSALGTVFLARMQRSGRFSFRSELVGNESGESRAQ